MVAWCTQLRLKLGLVCDSCASVVILIVVAETSHSDNRILSWLRLLAFPMYA